MRKRSCAAVTLTLLTPAFLAGCTPKNQDCDLQRQDCSTYHSGGTGGTGSGGASVSRSGTTVTGEAGGESARGGFGAHGETGGAGGHGGAGAGE